MREPRVPHRALLLRSQSFKILDELFFPSLLQPRFRWGKEATKKQPKLGTWQKPLSLPMILVPSRSWDSHLYLIYGFFRTLFTSLYAECFPQKLFSSLWAPMTQDVLDSLARVFSWLSLQTPRGDWPCDAQPRCQQKSRGLSRIQLCAVHRSRLQLPMDIWISGRQNAILEFCSLAIPDSLQDKPVFQITRLDKHIKPKPPFSSSNSTGKFGYRNQSMEHQHHVLLVPSRITAVCHSQRQIHPEQYTVFLAHEKAFMMFWREASLAAHHRSTIV